MSQRDYCSDTSRTGKDRKSREDYMIPVARGGPQQGGGPVTVADHKKFDQARGATELGETRGAQDAKAAGDA